jgi:hypothetical protein
MKKYVLISLLVCSNVASANWDSPIKPFSTKENNHETMLITWKTVDNIQQVCQTEHKKRGFGAFNYAVDACSFWNDVTKTCTIYTRKNPTMHDVGHEVRHCYQGNWH